MIEKRFLKELRVLQDSRTITGRAIVFNSTSQLLYEPRIGKFYESIKPEAITQDFLDKQDIVMLFNHNDKEVPLARSKNGQGTLNITRTDEGVEFSFEAKNTTLGNEVLEAVKSGDLDSCSFGFRGAKDSIIRGEDGILRRIISGFEKIADMSIVTFPAYESTSVDSRSFDEFDMKEKQEYFDKLNKEHLQLYYNKYK